MISILLPIHISCALISLSLFIWRGIMMWLNRPLKKRLLRRVLPDTVDTLFLASGIIMAFLMGVSPLESTWLAAKIAGLLVYIVLGSVALHYGRSVWIKHVSFVAALCVFAYVVAVAKAMDPMPWI